MERDRKGEKTRVERAFLRKHSLPLKFRKPSDPEQAREWLLDVANHLFKYPYAGPAKRFVAYGLMRFLSGKESLSRALRLLPPTEVKAGRPSISLEQVRTVTEMLVRKVPVKQIAGETRLSKSTIDRVQADYNALTFKTALQKVEVGEMLPDIEARDAQKRAGKISKQRRKAIMEGIARAISPKDLYQ